MRAARWSCCKLLELLILQKLLRLLLQLLHLPWRRAHLRLLIELLLQMLYQLLMRKLLLLLLLLQVASVRILQQENVAINLVHIDANNLCMSKAERILLQKCNQKLPATGAGAACAAEAEESAVVQEMSTDSLPVCSFAYK